MDNYVLQMLEIKLVERERRVIMQFKEKIEIFRMDRLFLDYKLNKSIKSRLIK